MLETQRLIENARCLLLAENDRGFHGDSRAYVIQNHGSYTHRPLLLLSRLFHGIQLFLDVSSSICL